MLRLGLLFGGVSEEYEISLRSAAAVLRHLSRERYEIFCIGITRRGNWLLVPPDADAIADDRWQTGGEDVYLLPDPTLRALLVRSGDGWRQLPLDLLFPVLHGGAGEGGELQGLFALSGIRFVGCDTRASALAMDKARTKELVAALGVPVAAHLLFSRSDADFPHAAADRAVRELGLPVFIKPNDSGSSLGAGRADTREELLLRLTEAAVHGEFVLAEEFVPAREIELAIAVQEGELTVSAPGEIRADGFYSYAEKYGRQSRATLCEEADIPESLRERLRTDAARIFRHLRCRGLARADFFLTEDGQVYFNEINTLPGFTDISMFPRLLTRERSFGELLDLLIAEACAG